MNSPRYSPRAECLSTVAPIAKIVERETWVRTAIFAAIIILVVLILVTPSLMGRAPPLTSLPILVMGVTPDQGNLTVFVAGSVQAYLYDDITVNVTRFNRENVSVGWTNASESYTYGIEVKAKLNLTYWRIHVWLLDQQDNYFEDNVTVRVYVDPNNSYRLTLAFTFPDDNSSMIVTRVPPDDYRVAIPRRGSLG